MAETPNTRRTEQPKRLIEANRGDMENAAANREKAFLLRRQRKTYREIASALGVSVATAHSYVEGYWKEIEATTKETAEMVRDQELTTLLEMEARWIPLAVHESLDVSKDVGNAHIEMPDFEAGMKAVDTVLKIQARRAKLLGIDVPEKIEVTQKHLTLEELDARLAEGRPKERSEP